MARKNSLRRDRQTDLLQAMSPGLQGELIMEMNKVWIAKVPFLDRILNDALDSETGSFHYAFVVDIAAHMKLSVHAQSEVYGKRHTLYILTRGLVVGLKNPSFLAKGISGAFAGRSCVLKSGSVWATDFLLADSSLQEPPEVRGLTYTENLILHRDLLFQLMDKHDLQCAGLRNHVRWWVNWLALQRAILREAGRRNRRRVSEKRKHIHFKTPFQTQGLFPTQMQIFLQSGSFSTQPPTPLHKDTDTSLTPSKRRMHLEIDIEADMFRSEVSEVMMGLPPLRT